MTETFNQLAIRLFREQTKYASFIKFLDNIEDFVDDKPSDAFEVFGYNNSRFVNTTKGWYKKPEEIELDPAGLETVKETFNKYGINFDTLEWYDD